jgi:hypothetical protein
MIRCPIDLNSCLAKSQTVVGRMLFSSVVRHALGVLIVTLLS